MEWTERQTYPFSTDNDSSKHQMGNDGQHSTTMKNQGSLVASGWQAEMMRVLIHLLFVRFYIPTISSVCLYFTYGQKQKFIHNTNLGQIDDA